MSQLCGEVAIGVDRIAIVHASYIYHKDMAYLAIELMENSKRGISLYWPYLDSHAA